MEFLTQGLNPPQKQAVETLNGPLLILAGAGSGKQEFLPIRGQSDSATNGWIG